MLAHKISLDLVRIVRSAAHAADCPFGFFATGLPNDLRVAASFGDPSSIDLDLYGRLAAEAATMEPNDLLVVEDPAAFWRSGSTACERSNTFIRFLASALVRNSEGQLIGALVVGDVSVHAGLSAAQTYVFRTHAVQIADFLELDLLRQSTSQPHASVNRGSSTERLRLLESVVVNANDAVLITAAEPIDLPGPRIVYCNAAFERSTGYTEAEMLGKTPRVLQAGKTNRESLDRLKRALVRWRPVEVELLNQRKDGTEFWVELSIVPVANEAGWFTHWVSVQRDITDRRRAEEVAVRARLAEAENRALEKEIENRKRVEAKLLHEAFHDGLTTLRNRAFFMNRLTAVLHEGEQQSSSFCTVLFIDLDRFKLVNDSLGHRAGDILLIEAAQRLRTCVRPEDTLARIGGDEFAILIERTTDVAAGLAVAGRIIDALSRPVRIGSQDVFSPASLGIAGPSDHAVTPEELLRNADIAMYEAKNSGSGYVIFEPSMYVEAVKSLEVQTDLRHAVARDEFQLQFQPIYNPKTNRITGIEALIRWQHPKRGRLGPGAFIPLAEEIGLIRDIGRWVLTESCTRMREWKDRYPGLDLRLSVNVSSDELKDAEFIPELRKILVTSRIDPCNLQLEVTEGVFLSRPDVVGRVLEEIRSIGVRIAIDDFGTGYSSLSYLDRFPIDTIKIDQTFVVKMQTRRRTLAIVETIIALGKSLDLDIVAEGVETEEQLGTLLRLGCGSVQGFLFARPMVASELDAKLKEMTVAK